MKQVQTRWKRVLGTLLISSLFMTMLPLSASASEGIPIDTAHFPDKGFRSYVAQECDHNQDGFLSSLEIHTTTSIYVGFFEYDPIQSLQGIEYFTHLKNLRCTGQPLNNLNICKNTALTFLDCSNCKLSTLDVHNQKALSYLDCSSNQLTTLNLSNNPALKYLYCSNNKLVTLDISNNPALLELKCYRNQLTKLDASKNTALTELVCIHNDMSSLNVGNNTALTSLGCGNNKLTSLDVSGCTSLTNLYCYHNQLTSLDLRANSALTEVSCFNNAIHTLTVPQNSVLKSLDCRRNKLTNLDVRNSTALTDLYCSENNLNSLNVNQNTALIRLDCGNNPLTSLNLSNNPNLIFRGCEFIKHTISTEHFDYTTLPRFDLNRVSNVVGGTFIPSSHTFVFDDGIEEASYMYDIDCPSDQAQMMKVTLQYNGPTRPTNPEKPLPTFIDVDPNEYYKTPIDWAIENDITSGIGGGKFGVGQTCTRAQIVMFLWCAAGKPQPANNVIHFNDVNKKDYFSKAVLWATEHNITSGIDATHFGPSKPCTREQIVMFLWRYMGSPKPNTKANFDDVKPSSYFVNAVSFAAEYGITAGVSPIHFGVGLPCKREQAMTFLWRAHNLSKPEKPTDPPMHQHNWVHHDAIGHNELIKDAWNEPIVERIREAHSLCNGCNKDFGPGEDGVNATGLHIGAEFGNDCNSYRSEFHAIYKVTGSIHRDAMYKWIEDSPAYDECSICGARK